MEFLKSMNKLALALVGFVLVAGLFYTIPLFQPAYDAYVKDKDSAASVVEATQKLENLKAQKAQNATVVSKLPREKNIYEAQGLSFGADASFAPLFEIVIDTARNSGIRIRSIDYNYAPSDDPIFTSKLSGYNVCELNIVAVGTYSQFQNFYKNIMREPYLTYLAEIEIKPWVENKSVLITGIKLRLYTKT